MRYDSRGVSEREWLAHRNQDGTGWIRAEVEGRRSASGGDLTRCVT